MRSGGAEYQGGFAVEGLWSPRLGARLSTGAMFSAGRLRDTTTTLSWLALDRSPVQVRLRPGVSLPTGTGASALSAVPGATGSVDPYLSVVAATGGVWVASVSTEGRMPVYPGRDGITQGAFGRADVLGGRRFGDAIVHLGASAIGQQDIVGDVALAAGGLWHASEQWSVGLSARVPVWSTPSPSPYPVALGLSVRRVFQAGAD